MTQPLLAIDTSGARLQLALARDAEALTEIDERERGHAEVLFAHIATLLSHAGLTYADLGRIAVITGPGSFSGLRIGLSAGRGLGLALGVPVIGVPRLLAHSLSAKGPESIGVLIDARRNEAWCERFSAPGGTGDGTRLLDAAAAREEVAGCAELIDIPFADIGRVAIFAADLDPAAFPPLPAYVRDADARPQAGARIARIGGTV